MIGLMIAPSSSFTASCTSATGAPAAAVSAASASTGIPARAARTSASRCPAASGSGTGSDCPEDAPARERPGHPTGQSGQPGPTPDREDSTMVKDSQDADVKLTGNDKDGKLRLSDHG